MQCTEKDQWFEHSIVQKELGYGMARLFESYVPRWLIKVQPLLCVAIYGFGKEGQGPELSEFITLLKY